MKQKTEVKELSLQSKLFTWLRLRIKSFDKRDFVLLIPLILLATTIPYWKEAPVNDPMVIYRETSQFVTTGFKELMNMGYTVHPPLINIWVSIFFIIFGRSPLSYTLSGVTVFLFLLFFVYSFMKKKYGWLTAAAVVVSLFTHPLILVNSVLLSNDLLLLALTLILIVGILEKNFLMQSVAFLLFGLAKETGLLIVLFIFGLYGMWFLYSIVSRQKISWKDVLQNLLAALPFFLSWGWWQLILRQYNQTEWRDMLYNPLGKSSFSVVADIFLHGAVFNRYLTTNLYNIGVIYFNWVISAGFLLASLYAFYLAVFKKKDVLDSTSLLLFTVVFVYILCALSFPTWTVIRYGIPVIGLILLAIFIVFRDSRQLTVGCSVVFLIVNVIGFYSSSDIVTQQLNPGSITLFGENFYNIPFSTNGPDRINYNMSILKVGKRQNDLIRFAYDNNAEIIVTNCIDLKLGEKVWSISVHNDFYPGMRANIQRQCFNWWDVSDFQSRIAGKSVVAVKEDEPFYSPTVHEILGTAGTVIWYTSNNK